MVEIVNAIVNFFKNVGSRLGADLIAIIAFSITALILIVALLVSYFSIEASTNRKVKQINRYLLNNPFVTDENIVEFNRIMKTRIPHSMRYQWQKFMVNRNDKPSTYLSEDNCITKPFRNSMFVQVLKQVKYVVAVVAIFAFAFVLGALPTGTSSLVEILLRASTIPMCIAVVTFIFLSLMNAKRSSLLNEVIYNFDEMQHALDRAVSTFPAFVDYEILFTRKEIVAGIPVLQEYLQKRAEYEQEELERARLSQVEHENYDFSKLGIKGNLIMDRAMKECEFYLGNRKILLADIDSIQNQKDLITSSFEDKNRANQRKLRDIKETIDRLKEKLNTTTNKIVGNDIIRQQADEVKKQQLVEKEMEDDTNHYNQDIQKLEDQIARKRQEIENNRKLVEATLINDFKDYSDKIYEELKKIADSHVFEEIDKLKDEKDKLAHELEDREQYIIEKNALYEEKVKENDSYRDIKQVVEQLKRDIIVKDQEIIGANKEVESRAKENKMLRAELERIKKDKYHEVYRYFDMDGVEFFYDENGEPYYYNDGALTYYQDAEKIKQLKTYRHKDGDDDGSAVLVEDVSQPENIQAQEPVEQPEPVQEDEPATETVETSELSAEELEELNNLGLESEEYQPQEEPVVASQTEEQSPVSEPDQEEQAQPNVDEQIEEKPETEIQQVEEPVVEPVIENASNEKVEEINQNPEAETESAPANVEESTRSIEEQEKSLNEQIAEQNKFLEQQHKELRETIDQAVKAIEANAVKTAPKKSTKKTTAKKATAKKKTTSKKSAEKSSTKKASGKSSAKKSTATKPKTSTKKKTESAVAETKPKKSKAKNNIFVFNVKKAPKGIELEGVDLSNFTELLTGEDTTKNSDKDNSTGDKNE